MRWRGPGLEGEAEPAAEEPSVCEYDSQGLGIALSSPQRSGELRVLDLGPASGASLASLAQVARVVRFADVGRELSVVPPGGATLGASALDRLVPPGSEPFDVVLAWDLIGRLSREGCVGLTGRLVTAGKPGMRVLAVEVTAPELAGRPLRFVVLGGGRVRCEPLPTGVRGGPDLAPAEMARRLTPFVVEHSFLLASGVREYLGILR